MAKAAIKFSYDDYKSLPESETKRYELLEGELALVPSPSWLHQSILRLLFKYLDSFIEARGLGEVRFAPVDVVLSDEDVVQPDLLFIAQDQLGIISEEAVRGAPDLVVEILAPATAQRDRTYKRTLYARHGVKEYWLVDPESKTVEVLKLGRRGYERAGLYKEKGGEALESPLLPGLRMPVDEIFLA